tara:strand:+ start:142 stop:348 length:207 start_codon:yes stop_codon:yes gene_type:complete
MSLNKELRSFGRRLDRVKLSVDPPKLRMVVADANTETVTSYPDEPPRDENGRMILDEWSMLIKVENKI